MVSIYAALLSMTLLFPLPVKAQGTVKMAEIERNEVTAALTEVILDEEITLPPETAAAEEQPEDPYAGASGLDIRYLLFLQDFRHSINDALTPFMETVSTVATHYLILTTLFVYWILDKRKGLYIISSMCLTLAINQLVKLTACVYRPWIRDSRIVPAGNAITTATGYSFPSGHTATAVPQLGGHIINDGKKHPWVAVLCVIGIFLITFSRNYLGVHTPQDVCVATLESFLCLFIMWKVFEYLDEHPEKEDWFLLGGVIFGFAAIAYFTFKPYPMTYVDGKLLVDPQKMMNDGYGDTAFLIAFCIGRYIEKKWVQFHPTGINPKGIIVAAIGMIIFVYMNDHIGAPLDHMLGSHWGHFARRMITVLFYTVAYPFVIKLVCGNDAAAETAEEEE